MKRRRSKRPGENLQSENLQFRAAAAFVGDIVRSRAVTLCFLGMGGLGIGIFLAVAGAGPALMAVLAAACLLLVLLWLAVSGYVEHKRISELEKLLKGLPEKYLLGEVLPKPVSSVEKRYFRIMKEVSASAVGIAEQAGREKEEYCGYVESWIHEMKTPLTACSLILDNGGDVRRLRRELKRADNLTESILYYARLRTAEKDVKIREFSAAQAVEEAVKSQMALLTGAGISVEAEGDFRVFSDEKSVCFCIKQLLNNCAKYCPGCQVHIRAEGGVIAVRDNGPGIPAHELPRVTQRGFTGSTRHMRYACGRTFDGTAQGKASGLATEKEKTGNIPEKEKPGNAPEKEKPRNAPEKEKPGNVPKKEKPENAPEKEKTENALEKKAGITDTAAKLGRQNEGTGMGLYIVKELCRRLDISMGIESEEGEYTCITLSFGSISSQG